MNYPSSFFFWVRVSLVAGVVSIFVHVFILSPASFSGKDALPTESRRELGYDRVIRTKTLRCGYGTWQPGVYKDLQTGKMAGLYVELIETMGRMSGLKVDWVGETDWGTIPEDIASGKIDSFCSGMAADAARGKFMLFTNPLSYWSFDVVVRADDTRFGSKNTITLSELNKPEYSTAYTEGDVLETVVKMELPLVKGVSLPLLATPADNLMHVVTKKTDFVIFPKIVVQQYEKSNPNKVRLIKVEPPLRTFGNVIAVGMDDLKLQQLLNASVNELVSSGSYRLITKKYDSLFPGAFIPVTGAHE